jgi:hypothetical protein
VLYGGRAGCDVVPLTFRISCAIYVSGLPSHIVVSYSRLVPSKFLSIIISPLSWICNFHFLAALYTSALFLYSTGDRDMLHLIWPLFLLIAVYSNLRDALDVHSMAMRCSCLGVATRTHPVSSAKSLVSWVDKCCFQSSMFP